MIKAALFDFDGTLSDREANAYATYREYLRPYFSDLDEISYEAVLQDMLYYDCNGSVNLRLRLHTLRAKYGDHLPDDFEEKFIPVYSENMFRFTHLRDESIEVLEKLQGKYKLAIISNGGSFSQHSKIDHVGIGKYFDQVVVSGDLGIHKPDKRIFAYTAEKLGVKCEECLMIGDVFSTDILGALSSSITPVWMCTDDRPSYGYKGYRIKDLRQLYGILEELDQNI